MPLSGIVHYLSVPKHVCSRSKHSQHRHGRRLNSICQPNTDHDNEARVRANGDKRVTWMETALWSSMLSSGLTRAHHRSIDTMKAHLRSCIVPEKQFMALVDACRTRSWLFMFHLRLIEECDVEVLVAPSFRCDGRVLFLKKKSIGFLFWAFCF